MKVKRASPRGMAWTVGVVAAMAILLGPSLTGTLPGGIDGQEPQSRRAEAATPVQDLLRIFDHLPEEVSPAVALGPASHWLLDPASQGTGTATARAPANLTELLGAVRREVPWNPLPIPNPPTGPEPLLAALTEYAAAVGVPIPDLGLLRLQVAGLRLQPEAERALAQLVLAYVQALDFERRATAALTAEDWQALGQDPFPSPGLLAGQSQEAFEKRRAEALAKVVMTDRMQAADLLLRTIERTKSAISLPPETARTPSGQAVTPSLPSNTQPPQPNALEATTASDPIWGKLHVLMDLGRPVSPLPELPPFDLPMALALLATTVGEPVQQQLLTENLQGLPPSLSQAVARIVTARVAGLMTGDPTLHGRLLLHAIEEAEPTLQAWAALDRLQRQPNGTPPTITPDALLQWTAHGQRGQLADALGGGVDDVETPALAALLVREGVASHQAKNVQRNLPPQVALGAAIALHGIQQATATQEAVKARLPADEAAALRAPMRVAQLLEADRWEADEAALVEAWARGMAALDESARQELASAQLRVLLAAETAVGVLEEYTRSVASGKVADLPLGASPQTDLPDDGPAPWYRRVADAIIGFQLIGTARAQPLPPPPCPDTPLSDCDQDVWLNVLSGTILITGFGRTIVGPGLASSPILHIDLGGDDTYLVPVGGGGNGAKVQVAIDLGGNDRHDATGPLAQGAAAGTGSVGILWDQEGDDVYVHRCVGICGAQGYGADGGLGALVDRQGADRFEARDSRAHGAGWEGGIGILHDAGPGADRLVAGRGQGFASGVGSLAILLNDGDNSPNEYATVTANPRYQGGRNGAQATGILIDLGGPGTVYSNALVPLDAGWTYMSFHDDSSAGERARKDDALWLDMPPGATHPGLGIDTRAGDGDGDGFHNWVELLAGSDPADAGSTPPQTATGTILGFMPDPNEVDPGEPPSPDDPFAGIELSVDDLQLCAQEVRPGEECPESQRTLLLRIGSSAPDTNAHAALVLIELGGNDTYAAEVAGPGRFFRTDGTAIDGLGSIAIDLAGDDHYLDPGTPTQGSVVLSGDNATTLSTAAQQAWAMACSSLANATSDREGFVLAKADCIAANRNPPMPNVGPRTITNPMLAPLSLLLELSGNDSYEAGERSQGSASAPPCRARGITGVTPMSQLPGAAWLVDMEGNDAYFAGSASQAAVIQEAGRAGLLDLRGDDAYSFVTQAESRVTTTAARTSSTGCSPSVVSMANTAILYDGSGRDMYNGTRASVRYSSGNQETGFATQGIATANQAIELGLFLDEGPEIDAYLMLDETSALVDLTELKNGARRMGQNGGGGYFLDGLTGLVVLDDLDGDGAPNLVETLMGTNPYSSKDGAGTLWAACSPDALLGPQAIERCQSGQGAWLRRPAPAAAVTLPGLLIGGHDDAVYSESFTFMVDVGGNNTYAGPYIGGSRAIVAGITGPQQYSTELAQGLLAPVTLVLDAGTGDTVYLPGFAGACDLEGERPTPAQRMHLCPSLGGAVNSIAILADAGGNNSFETEAAMNVTSAGSWELDLTTQGAAAETGVGVLVTWNSTNQFIANLTVKAKQQPAAAPLSIQANGLAQGAAHGGIGILASLGGLEDSYAVAIKAASPQISIHSISQGAAQNSKGFTLIPEPAEAATLGLLLDDGGSNVFRAPGSAQGFARLLEHAAATGYYAHKTSSNAYAVVGALWSGDGDDVFEAGRSSQGAGTGIKALHGVSASISVAATNGAVVPLGFLHDAGGNDEYRMTATGIGDAQGAGRTKGAGILLDIAGDDAYLAGNATSVQGAGHEGWGALLDLGGNDLYRAADQAQGFAGGNSIVGETGTTSVIAPHRPTLGLLLDLHGRDRYDLAGRGQGAVAMAPADGVSHALLLDAGGNDKYSSGSDKLQVWAFPSGAAEPAFPDNDWVWQSTSSPNPSSRTGLGIDAHGLHEAMPFLKQYAVRMRALEAWQGDTWLPDGAKAAGSIRLRAFVEVPTGDPQTIDRVAFASDNRVLGHGIHNRQASQGTVLAYDLVWNTRSDTLPEAYPDGSYRIYASVFLQARDGPGAAGTPTLPAVESDPHEIVVDNGPVVVVEPILENVISPPLGRSVDLHLVISVPGAYVTLANESNGGPPTVFWQGHLLPGKQKVAVTGHAIDGTVWKDGPQNITVVARDESGQQAPPASFTVLVDGTPPTSGVATPAFANLDAMTSTGSLALSWSADDQAGTGVASVCLLRFEAWDSPGPAPDWPLHQHCYSGTQSIVVPVEPEQAATNLTLHFMTVAVDEAGNRESPCLDGESPPEPRSCFLAKRAADPRSVRNITIDFVPPLIQDLRINGLPAGDAIIAPGSQVNFTARVTDQGTQFHPPGRVFLRLPGLRDGEATTNAIEAEMRTDGTGNYWYDSWGDLNRDLHSGLAREERHGFTILAADRAGNLVTEIQDVHVDSLPPRVTPLSVRFVETAPDGTETENANARNGLLARIRVDVRDAKPAFLTADFSAFGGESDMAVNCATDPFDAHGRVCEYFLDGMRDGDYLVPLNAVDQAGNQNGAQAVVITVREQPLRMLGIKVTGVAHDGFRVQWTTDSPGSSRVEFGRVAARLDQAIVVPGPTTHHVVDVTGLAPSTSYYIRVASVSESGVRNESAVLPTPVRTTNAYSFALDSFPAAPVRGLASFQYDLAVHTGQAPVSATWSLQDAASDASPFELETKSLTAGDGAWRFDTRSFADGRYFLVIDLDRGGDQARVLSPEFRIDNTEPVIVPTSPRPGASVAEVRPTFHVVLFDPMGQGPPAAQDLRVLHRSERITPTLVSDTVQEGSQQRRITFRLPYDLQQGPQSLVMSVADMAGNSASADWRFMVDNQPPTSMGAVNVTYQPGPASAKPGGFAHIAVTLADPSKVASATLDARRVTGSDTPVPLSLVNGRWHAKLPIATDAADGEAHLPVTAVDALGNAGPAGIVRIEVDARPPRLLRVEASGIGYTNATLRLATDEATQAWISGQSAPAAWQAQHTLLAEALSPNSDNIVTILVQDRAGNTASSASLVTTRPDNDAPGTVGALQASSPAEGVVHLSWLPASDNAGIRLYQVDRTDRNGNTSFAAINTTFRDASAAPGAFATYHVRAIDVAGNAGPATEIHVRVLALLRLDNASVTPLIGASDEPFTFRVTYRHAGGVPAERVAVSVAGKTHLLDRVGTDCVLGCMYEVSLFLAPSTLFEADEAIQFRAARDGFEAHASLEEAPVVLRAAGHGGVIDLNGEGHDAPGPTLPALLFLLMLTALLALRRKRSDP